MPTVRFNGKLQFQPMHEKRTHFIWFRGITFIATFFLNYLIKMAGWGKNTGEKYLKMPGNMD